jgi:hypothetical protein
MIAIRTSTVAALVVGLGFAGLAAAQSKVWNFGDTSPNGACTGNYDTVGQAGGVSNLGNTINCSMQPNGSATTLTVNAFSAANAGSTYAAAGINNWGTGSGFGVRHSGEVTGSPNHAMDSNSTANAQGVVTSAQTDMLLLNFTSAQILKTVTLGWSGADGDFQLLRWKNAGAATAVAGKTAATLLSSGWELVSTVNGAANISTPDQSYGVNAGNLSSSYWLISAYNSAFGGATLGGINDAMKVLGVTAVAEPGSLALAGLALAAVAGLRRRNQRAAA